MGLGVRLTGISTPFGGVSWEYTAKGKSGNSLRLPPDQKIRVFISSIHGIEKYDTIRTELKTVIEATALADIYLSEEGDNLTLPSGEHYIRALEDSDVCIFLIDNVDGINTEVQAEIDIVKKQGIRALYYFCDENSSEKTVLEQSIAGSNCAKSKTVHSFSDFGKDGADDLINDIIAIYHYYCKGTVISKQDDENEEFQYLDISDAEKIQHPTVPKTILNNIDKCKAYFVEFTTGHPYTRFPDEAEKSNEIDEWCVQFLPILFEGKSVKHFNVGMFLEVLKEQQQDAFYQVVQTRWQAIQSYFLGNVSKCIQHLEEALKCAKETKQPVWVIKDILIDLRNQYLVLYTMNNKFSDSDAQKELTNSNEEVYYPTLDRVNDSLHEKYIENLFKDRIKSPYSVTFGNDLGQYCGLLASPYVISMYNGSLTHIILIYEKIRNFLFFLCNKYDNWGFRRDMLKVAIYDGTENEINGIQNAFPEILNNLTATDALSIMQFCENQPVEYKRIISQLRAFGTVGYYLDNNNFKIYEAIILTEIDKWLNKPSPIFAIGQSVFWGLSRVSYRMSQDTLAQICCTFIDKRYTRWYVDMFKFIANRMDLREMTDNSATQLVTHIISVLENDDQRVQIQYYPHVLWVLRSQNRALTEELDKKISEFLPEYYNNDYKLNTTNNKEQDFPFFLQQYVQQVKTVNAEQGKNGVYLGYGARTIVAIRSILLQSNTKYSVEIMDSIISAAVDTLIVSEEGIRTKLDAISLLSYIVVKYPDDYRRNGNVFKQLIEDAKTIESCGHDFLSSNIDSISLKICLQFLFAAMGRDTYADILELLPYIQNDIPTTISVTSVITEYLESADCVPLSPRLESLLLQNVLQWLLSDQLDIRCNATRILFNLSRNPENSKIINHQLISLVDSDNVYIKNLILRNIYKREVVTEKTREYIVSKCENDACFVVRMVCGEVKKQYQQSEHTSPTI